MWSGPFATDAQGGITQSLINSFNQCPYRAYIKYILGLKENKPESPQLMWGDPPTGRATPRGAEPPCIIIHTFLIMFTRLKQ